MADRSSQRIEGNHTNDRAADGKCPACGEAAAPLFRTPDRNRQVSRDGFSYYRCPACEFVFIGSSPADLARYYPGDYYDVPASAEAIEAAAAKERYKLDIVRRFAPTGRLVEIGPSRGHFCSLAKQAGYKVTAIERDTQCCAFIQDKLGIEVINAETSDALAQVSDADIVVLWHVLEHFVDPWAVLASVHRALVPQGVLIVATPDPSSFQSRLFGRFWSHLDAPRHLCLIPPDLLRRKGRELGLEQIWRTTIDAGSIACNGFGWAYSLPNFVRGRLSRRIARRLGVMLGTLAKPFEQREGRGAAYTAVFRKTA